MKPTTLTFTVKCGLETTHWVNVVLCPSRRAMRRFLKASAAYDASEANAVCFQPSWAWDGCVAEIYFCRDYLTLSTIAHECAHAAFHRSVLVGIPYEHKDFQEWLAENTGSLTDTIVALFDKERIPVRYEVVNRRLV